MGLNRDIMKFDKRLIARNLRDGNLTKEELEEMLKRLPDSSDNAILPDGELNRQVSPSSDQRQS